MATMAKGAWLHCSSDLKTHHQQLLLAVESCHGIQQFNQVHSQLIVRGLFHHPLVAGRAVKKLCSDPLTAPRAISLFHHLYHPDAFISNTILRSLSHSSSSAAALRFYYHGMLARCVPPNHYTFPLLIKLCADNWLVFDGEKAHARVHKLGFEQDVFARNSLIRMYSVFGRVSDARLLFDSSLTLDLVSYNSMIDGHVKNGETGAARKLFDEMPVRDVWNWNCMIAGYVAVGDLEAANELFERMPDRDVVSWNCMIDGCVRVGNVPLALEFFNRMPARNVVSWNSMLALHVRAKSFWECLKMFDEMMESGEAVPNEATLVSVLTACAHLGKLSVGMWVHSFIKSNNIKVDVLLSTCLLTMYVKCGAMDLARDVFDEMPVRNVVSWNSMIMGYGLHGNGEKALELFLEMEKKGPKPNDATFVCVLSACTHAGMVMEGWWYFDLMRRVYNIEPKVEHYGCIVDLLARAGLVKNSEELIKYVSVKGGGSALWGALLSGCTTHMDSELGEIVAKRLIELEPMDIGPYIMLSNTYAAQGRWDDVERVRVMIREKGLQKEAASSVVHLEDFESKYFVKNYSVHRKRIMYSMLSELGAHIKLSPAGSIEKDNFRP
ncbi:pentatricopeptide repeat-containing protein At3g29230-like [Lotus japonicus]|uniref:pentatricopeptide repeat-containing protein At3g29230-like n=1 Tax=Lotus japonicus TaxID=34305 RepID=UPI002590F1A0|nr:pentatricopeptide repeat-containing protein At3g29230-like [Lotus japonicus]